eukprot:3473229-Amphidinium_carterae.1
MAMPAKQPQETLLLLRVLLSQCHVLRVPLLFLKMRKAFDSVKHSAIIDMMIAKGASNWLIRAILSGLIGKTVFMTTPSGDVSLPQ